MGKKSAELIELMNYMRARTEAYYNALPEETRVANGTWEVWSPKDALAHLTFWQSNLLEILNSLELPPPEQPPFGERNHANYLNYENQPWAEVHSAYAGSFDKILELVKTYSDGDLETPNRFARIPNGSLQGTILDNTFTHTATHLGELIAKNGDQRAGQELRELATQRLIEFDPSPRSQGVALYNLACSYALAGQSKRTIELLSRAFRFRPDLLDFSKQDTDFDPVRDQPEFQALYN